MPTSATPSQASQVPFLEHSPLGGFLSYLIPGLGQIYQGRIGKGLLFLVCIYFLFFYGMRMGNWSNVFLPDTAELNNPWGLPFPVLTNLYNRPQFAGQFWVGVAAWPAIWQYLTFDRNQDSHPLLGTLERTPSESELNRMQSNGDKTWDLAWVYTVIAGMLNILVIYDAFAGPAFGSMGLEMLPEGRG